MAVLFHIRAYFPCFGSKSLPDVTQFIMKSGWNLCQQSGAIIIDSVFVSEDVSSEHGDKAANVEVTRQVRVDAE